MNVENGKKGGSGNQVLAPENVNLQGWQTGETLK